MFQVRRRSRRVVRPGVEDVVGGGDRFTFKPVLSTSKVVARLAEEPAAPAVAPGPQQDDVDRMVAQVQELIGGEFFGRTVRVEGARLYFPDADWHMASAVSCVVMADGGDGALLTYFGASEIWEARPFKHRVPVDVRGATPLEQPVLGEPDYSASVANLVTSCLLAADPAASWR